MLKSFDFYEFTIINNSLSNQIWCHLDGQDVCCALGCKKGLLFGLNVGEMKCVDKSFSKWLFTKRIFQNSLVCLIFNDKKKVLFALGSDTLINDTIKIFSFKRKNENNEPLLVNQHHIKALKPDQMIDAIFIDEQLQSMVIGLKNGEIIIYSGDIYNFKNLKCFRITHLNINIQNIKIISNILYIITNQGVYVYDLACNKIIKSQIFIDQSTCTKQAISVLKVNDEKLLLLSSKNVISAYKKLEKIDTVVMNDFIIMQTSLENQTLLICRTSSNTTKIIILEYNFREKFIVFSKEIPNHVNLVFSEWKNFYILLENHQLIEIKPLSFMIKYEHLTSNHFYSLALDLCKNSKKEKLIYNTYKNYGDYLFSIGDFPNSIEQYIYTIGYLEPSYVVYKFLDFQYINHLVSYLQKLYQQNLADSQYVTLLVTCYIKLKQFNKIDNFLSDEKFFFDEEELIQVLYTTNLFTYVLKFAKKFNKFKWVIKVLIENFKDYENAVFYIKNIKDTDALIDIIKIYGIDLIQHSSKTFLEILEKILTSKDQKLNDILPIFINNDALLMEFLEKVKAGILKDPYIYNTMIELEVYDMVRTTDNKEKLMKEKRIIELLKHHKEFFNFEDLVIFFQIHHFNEGIICILEENEKYEELINFYSNRNNVDGIIYLCKKYGEKASIWKMVLMKIIENHYEMYLEEIIQLVLENKAIEPLKLLQIIHTWDNEIQYTSIKEYLLFYINNYIKQIQDIDQEIEKSEKKLENLTNIINGQDELRKEYSTTICSICIKELKIPLIHFTCNHSYHQLCYESELIEQNKCIICQRNEERKTSINNDKKMLNELCLKELKITNDPIKVFEKYIKMGIMDENI